MPPLPINFSEFVVESLLVVGDPPVGFGLAREGAEILTRNYAEFLDADAVGAAALR